MAAEAQYQTGMALGDKVECIAQMQSANGAPGTFRLPAFGRRKCNGWAVKTLAQARGQYADHALMPGFIVKDEGITVGHIDFLRQGERRFLHAGLDVPALTVERIELSCQVGSPVGIVRQQALDTHRHVGETSRGIQPWSDHEAQIMGADTRGIASGDAQQRSNARARASGAHAPQSLVDQDAVVVVQPHHVSDGTECHQVEQFGEIRFLSLREPDPAPQLRAQGNQYIKHDTDPGQVLAGKSAAMLIGIHDARRRRKFRPRQMVIGNQHCDSALVCFRHAFHAGNAVIHGDQEIRLASGGKTHNFRSEPIAVFKTIRHQILNLRAETLQTEHANRTGGGAIGIVIGHDQQTLLRRDRIGQHTGHVCAMEQPVEGEQAGQAGVELGGPAYAARGVDSGQYRMQAAFAQSGPDRRRHLAFDDTRSVHCGMLSAAGRRHQRYRCLRSTDQRYAR